MRPHDWALICGWPVEADTAEAFALGARFDLAGREASELQLICAVCFQGWVAATLPCPGRVFPDEAAPYLRAVIQLPRDQRRQRRTADRRNARRGIEIPKATAGVRFPTKPDPLAAVHRMLAQEDGR